MEFSAAIPWILITLHYFNFYTCVGQCVSEYYTVCYFDIANMTSDGGAKLRKAFEKVTIVSVDKLIVSNNPSGPFLQRFTSFIDTISYSVYRETTFNVPDGNTISEIVIMGAASLRAFVCGADTLLENLVIYQSSLDRLPSTLAKMTRLNKLSITLGKLIDLRLDMLVNNQNLTSLTLGYNQIQEIIPVTDHRSKVLSIEKLELFGNRLQHLDMSVFLSLLKLRQLDVRQNMIVRVSAATPLALPMLVELDLTSNSITSFNLRNLTITDLQSLSLWTNSMQQMPSLPKSLPKLKSAIFYGNNLTQLNLGFFRPYQNLQLIDCSANRITTVRSSSFIRLKVNELILSYNQITTINLTNCEMPNLTHLDLSNNQLTVVPPVLNRYPNARLIMDRNPLSCDSLMPFKDNLMNYKHQKDQRPTFVACSTTSSLVLGETIKICCDK